MGFFTKLKGTGGSNNSAPTTPAPCAKKHKVTVKLRYKDDKSDVLATSCIVRKGGTTVDGGPLAAGELQASNLDDGSYEVSFPDIHPDEWAAE